MPTGSKQFESALALRAPAAILRNIFLYACDLLSVLYPVPLCFKDAVGDHLRLLVKSLNFILFTFRHLVL